MASRSKCRICGHSNGDYSSLANSVQDAYPPYLSPFMTSNDAPSGFVKAQIEQELVAESEALIELDFRITDLRLQLEELVRQRGRRQQKIKDCKFALNPVRRLPAEILSEVFLYFPKGVEVYLEKESSINPKKTIWILPQVSRQWRAVALSLHQLWSIVRLVQSDFQAGPDGRAPSNASFMLGTQLYRAGSIPLSVSIIAKDLRGPTNHPLLQILFSTAEKWKELVLVLPFLCFPSLQKHCPASFPKLISLHLWPTRYTDDAGTLSLVKSIFQFCPQLSTIQTYSDLLSSWELPLNQIKHFTCFYATSVYNCIQALTALPNLLDYCATRYGDAHVVEDRQFRHEKLEKLTLRNVSPRPIFLLLFLHAPSLRSLEISNLFDIELLLTFLQTSGRRLTNLQLQSDSLTDADCIKILEKVPSLKSLTLDSPLVYMGAFVKQLISIDEPMLIPSLTFLKLVGSPVLEAAEITELKEARPGLAFLGGKFAIR